MQVNWELRLSKREAALRIAEEKILEDQQYISQARLAVSRCEDSLRQREQDVQQESEVTILRLICFFRVSYSLWWVIANYNVKARCHAKRQCALFTWSVHLTLYIGTPIGFNGCVSKTDSYFTDESSNCMVLDIGNSFKT